MANVYNIWKVICWVACLTFELNRFDKYARTHTLTLASVILLYKNKQLFNEKTEERINVSERKHAHIFHVFYNLFYFD